MVRTFLWLCCLLSSCQTPTSPAAQALLLAPPQDWAKVLPPVQAQGKDAAPALMQALRQHPQGPGRQAAIQLLGSLQSAKARPLLESFLHANDPQAADAALALGKMLSTDSMALLMDCLDQHDNPVLLRTAAACALWDLDNKAAAWPMFKAILLATTPEGPALLAQQGLPGKNRWAHERYLCIQTIRRSMAAPAGLDEDASWPRLQAAVLRLEGQIQ